MLISNG